MALTTRGAHHVHTFTCLSVHTWIHTRLYNWLFDFEFIVCWRHE